MTDQLTKFDFYRWVYKLFCNLCLNFALWISILELGRRYTSKEFPAELQIKSL